jgi:hypothetical protein
MAADICNKYIFNTVTVRKCRQYMSEILHCTEKLKQIFPAMKLLGLVPNFYIFVSGSNLYIPTFSLIWNLIHSQRQKDIDYND